MPRSRISASASKTTSTIFGARPSDGSSSSRTSGPATSARAIASCCCWPPESAPAWRRAELLDDREELVDRFDVLGAPSRRAAAGEAEPEVLLDRQLGEDAPPLRHERDAGARDRLGRAPAQRLRRRGGSRPPRGGTRPMIACSVVDLPAPFGPIRPTISPLPTSRSRPRTAGDAAVADLEVVELEHRRRSLVVLPARRSRRGRRRRRRGWRGSRPACPAASVVPWSSTWMRSQTSMISAMLWSISSTPAPWSSRTARTTAAKSGTSASGSPAAGSSMSTNAGSVASARATPSRRSSPWASAAAGASPSASSPSRSSSSSARARASRGRAPDAERRDLDVLAHGQLAERAAVLERAREPGAPAPVRAPAGDVALVELDRAGGREVEAGDQVDERRLAGAVRADQADDLVPVQLERDVVERLHALERARDGGGPERSPGPPRRVRQTTSLPPTRS